MSLQFFTCQNFNNKNNFGHSELEGDMFALLKATQKMSAMQPKKIVDLSNFNCLTDALPGLKLFF